MTRRSRPFSVVSVCGRRARVFAARGGPGAGAIICLLFAASCTQKMAHQPTYRPLAPSSFFGDGLSARPTIPGTVAREDDQNSSPGLSQFKSGDSYVDRIPLPVTPQLVERGRGRYGIYCAACHGKSGEGDGPVSGNMEYRFPPPLPFSADEVRGRPVGFYFEAITKGYQAMGRYAHQVNARDRWAIIAYIRELQGRQPAAPISAPAGKNPLRPAP